MCTHMNNFDVFFEVVQRKKKQKKKMSYDRALTRFSSDGRLFQIEYASAAVLSSTTVLAIHGDKVIVAAVEKQDMMKLQKQETSRKVCLLDDHIMCVYAGVPADARVLIEKAQFECQSHRLTYEDSISVETIAKYIATVQLKYTQCGGVRPFGVSTLICGFDTLGNPHIYETIPSGLLNEWKARGIGRYGHPVQEYLEKYYQKDMPEDEVLRVAIGSLREIADRKAKNIEVAIIRPGQQMEFLSDKKVEEIVKSIDNRQDRTLIPVTP